MYLRRYRREDLEDIFALDCASFAAPFCFSRQTMRQCAERQGALPLLALETGTDRLLGFVIVQLELAAGERAGYVATLDVAPKARRRGVASWLMASAETAAANEGAQAMLLHVSVDNPGAVALYERLGYVRLHEARHFYARNVHAWAYRKVLARALAMDVAENPGAVGTVKDRSEAS